MRYSTPELRSLGGLTYLTLGAKGSCPDGGQDANDQNCAGGNIPKDDGNPNGSGGSFGG